MSPQTFTVVLTEEEHVTLCGLVHDSEAVYTPGIFSDAWASLRDKFPLANFHKGVADGVVDYDPDAGE